MHHGSGVEASAERRAAQLRRCSFREGNEGELRCFRRDGLIAADPAGRGIDEGGTSPDEGVECRFTMLPEPLTQELVIGRALFFHVLEGSVTLPQMADKNWGHAGLEPPFAIDHTSRESPGVPLHYRDRRTEPLCRPTAVLSIGSRGNLNSPGL